MVKKLDRINVKKEFISIGKNFKILMILSFIHSISIINSFGNFFGISTLGGNVEFGPAIIVFSVINYISAISLLVTYFYQKRTLDCIKRINESYNDISLRSFQSNLTSSIVMNLIGLIGFVVSISIMMGRSIQLSILTEKGYTRDQIETALQIFTDIGSNIMVLLIGSAIGTLLEIMAWKKFEEFFNSNNTIFPESIRQDLMINSGRLINASAFSFFELGTDVFIPFIGLGSILGFYYYIVAYKNLGRAFLLLEESEVELSELTLKISQKEILPGEIGTTMEKIVKKIDSLEEKIDLMNNKIDLLIEKKDEKP